MFIFYEFLFEMPREALFIMLCYVMLSCCNKKIFDLMFTSLIISIKLICITPI